MVSEIAVARQMKHLQLQGLKDGCYTRMGGSCKKTDRFDLCKLCLIDGDVARLKNHFESRFDSNLESSKLADYYH